MAGAVSFHVAPPSPLRRMPFEIPAHTTPGRAGSIASEKTFRSFMGLPVAGGEKDLPPSVDLKTPPLTEPAYTASGACGSTARHCTNSCRLAAADAAAQDVPPSALFQTPSPLVPT